MCLSVLEYLVFHFSLPIYALSLILFYFFHPPWSVACILVVLHWSYFFLFLYSYQTLSKTNPQKHVHQIILGFTTWPSPVGSSCLEEGHCRSWLLWSNFTLLSSTATLLHAHSLPEKLAHTMLRNMPSCIRHTICCELGDHEFYVHKERAMHITAGHCGLL